MHIFIVCANILGRSKTFTKGVVNPRRDAWAGSAGVNHKRLFRGTSTNDMKK